jgi:hypothetical protein
MVERVEYPASQSSRVGRVSRCSGGPSGVVDHLVNIVGSMRSQALRTELIE